MKKHWQLIPSSRKIRPPAADPKGKPVDTPKKEDAKGPITVRGKDKVEIPIEPKGKAEDPKGTPAADPKKKDAAVEPPKDVKITQIFADRLDKPTQEDLKSLPIPQEGEGFFMRLHPAYFFEFLNHPFSVNRETDDYRELDDSIKENGINEPIKARPREGSGLELISGHRRHDVAMQLNYPVPVVIVQVDNDTAQIECVDGNLHRKDIPTSEIARRVSHFCPLIRLFCSATLLQQNALAEPIRITMQSAKQKHNESFGSREKHQKTISVCD